ncbi:MAG: metallophosphoesterase, partial [Acidobacteriota bacterium]|nr:metallophosphoesterase [Acidobacteriota bacterium]
MVAVGDLHGNHDKLIRLLTAAHVIDADLRWSGGEDHLVVAGDFLDRGAEDRQLMDLLRRLERESVAAGGRVHVLLGNHEVMNLFRDTRYVSAAAHRHFAGEETKSERRTALGEFAALERSLRRRGMLRDFNKEYPPGFFGRQKSFNPEGEYGGWLLRLPTIVKINEVVYVHGGLSEEFAALGVDGINRLITDVIVRYLEFRQVLERDGAISRVMDSTQINEAASRVLERRRRNHSSDLREAAKGLLAAAADPVLGNQGPLWYRGNALQDERLERYTVERSLELLGAKAIVVAHSQTSNRRITSRFHGRLLRIDHGIDGSETPLALIAEQGEILAFDSSTLQTSEPLRELPPGQLRNSGAAELSDEEIERLLSKSPVVAS